MTKNVEHCSMVFWRLWTASWNFFNCAYWTWTNPTFRGRDRSPSSVLLLPNHMLLHVNYLHRD